VAGDAPGHFPLIVFPKRERHNRRPRGGGGSELFLPGPRRQGQRLGGAFDNLEQRFAAAVQASPQGVDPDLVLVLEIAGSVEEFVRAAERVPGLEWIGEWGTPDLPATTDFYVQREEDGESVRASLFLLFSNQTAMREMLRLWQKFLRDEAFPHGLTRWRYVFSRLHSIRVWDASDRITPELRDDWQSRIEAGANIVPFEIELWFHHQPAKRDRAETDVRAALEELAGRVVGATRIDEIEYHAIIGTMPIRAIPDIRNLTDVRLFRSRDIMFVRPVAQAFVRAPEPEEIIQAQAQAKPLPIAGLHPVVALLDGFPMENHPALAGRIIVDDPDAWGPGIAVTDRLHGTGMASLIVHGDLAANEDALTRPIYIRPVLKPQGPDWLNIRREAIPEDVSFVDILHRAIRRLFEEEPADRGRVHIVNISIGDRARIFDRLLSPCAKLLDWLAWKYQVLMVVSAGNHGADLEINIPRDRLTTCDPADLERELLKSIDRDGINRRLLSPAESVNCVTVGALYEDQSRAQQFPNSVAAYQRVLPSPYNAQGFGYRRAIKPDILTPGGRLLLREKLPNPSNHAVVEMLDHSRGPGQCVATPPRNALAPTASYSRGTSNAAAIASRTAAQIYDVLQDAAQITTPIPEEFIAVVLKTTLVHGASWGDMASRYDAALQLDPRTAREYVAKYLGNGRADFSRSIICNQNRITVLGFGMIPDGAADVFEFPLPGALSGQRVTRDLRVTLSWMSPINVRHYNYRRAHLWFSFPNDGAGPALFVPRRRTEAHALASTRGTIQHEIFTGGDARVYRDNALMQIWVNCRADAGILEDLVPYCLAVSLEVPDGTAIPIYQQVAAGIRQQIPIRTRG
jgi:hypothetical protein